jgi:uncharacterized protein YggE
MRHSILLLLALTCAPAPVLAAEQIPPRITVNGTGSVKTAPDLAAIDFSVRGEGATSDGAVSALVGRRKQIEAGLASFGAAIELRTGLVSVSEVRGKDCQRYGPPQLSVGDCAILGYLAELPFTIRTAQVAKAGTIVGLIGRLEGISPRISNFSLADPKVAQRRAIAAALADAKDKAEAIAAGTGTHLGRLLQATNASYAQPEANEIIVTGSRLAPPPPPPPPPITVDLTPQPIETAAQVTVAYEIAP